MFVRQGKKRTARHNLQIASLLSFVAGLVSVTGFLAVAQLTTNVTGHFAFLVDEVYKLNPWHSLVYFLYILFFLAGSFTSNFAIEKISRRDSNYVYIIPTFVESLILFFLGIFGKYLLPENPHLIACILLFAMGAQNALVTRISNAVVRTTHLTGLFTDLGIELSQLFFYKDKDSREELTKIIKLRLIIISFFFIGGIIGGIAYTKMGLYTLILGSVTLILGIIYENIKLKLRLLQKKIRQ